MDTITYQTFEREVISVPNNSMPVLNLGYLSNTTDLPAKIQKAFAVSVNFLTSGCHRVKILACHYCRNSHDHSELITTVKRELEANAELAYAKYTLQESKDNLHFSIIISE